MRNFSKFWIIIFICGFIAGIFIRSFLDFGWALAGFFIFLGIVFLVSHVSHRVAHIIIAIFLIAVALGVARYELKDTSGNLSELERNLNKNAILQGIIIDEPDERENYTRYVVKVNGEKLLLYLPHYPTFNYGDEIELKGILKEPENFSDEFNWQAYLAKDEIYHEMFYPEVKLLSSGKGNWIKENLFALKNNFIGALSKVIPEPHSAFMAGLTVGAKQSMPKELLEDFRKTGVIHVVVLSGYNITLVADTIVKFFSFLPRVFGIGLGILGIVLFAVMTGASATVVRASIMAILVVVARSTGRIYAITWALFLTGFLMVLHNPKILVFDTGFQLSFLATLALIHLAPYFEKKLKFIPQKFKLREIASATIAVQIFVLPLLLYKMGLFSVVSLPANLLILIFVPMTMFFGFVAGGIGMLSEILSIPFGWLSYAFLQYELWVVKIFAKLPFSSFIISGFPFWMVLAVYFIYAIILYRYLYKGESKC